MSKRQPARLPWQVLTKLAATEPWAFDYIMERREAGVPPSGYSFGESRPSFSISADSPRFPSAAFVRVGGDKAQYKTPSKLR